MIMVCPPPVLFCNNAAIVKWGFGMSQLLAIGASLVCGALVAALMRLNASLAEALGVLESSFVVHLVGTLFALLLVGRSLGTSTTSRILAAPKALLGVGIVGVVIVLLSNMVVPKLGMALSTGIVVATTLILSVVADHFGWFGLPQLRVTLRRAFGVATALVGVLCLYLR